jgi:hypothetical protein
MVTVEFIIVMGRRAVVLCEHLAKGLKVSPVIIGLDNANP